jgi:DivIVA domain-containing protein
MDSSIATPSLDALRTVEFQNSFRGYSIDEVDGFLDKAAEEHDALRDQYRQMQNQLRLAADRIKQLEASTKDERISVQPVATEPKPVPTPPASSSAATQEVTSIIAMAQEFVATAKREATDQAAALMARSQEQARNILEEAKSNALDEVTQLEGRKARLSEEITTLARFIATERNRLKSSLGEMSAWLENALAMRETSAAEPNPVPSQPTAPSAPVAAAPQPTTPSEPNRITTIGEVSQFKLDND